MSEHWVLLNGQFVEQRSAVVSAYDAAFLHGVGLFETMRAGGGRVFKLEAHLSRLLNSAAKLLAPMDRTVLPDAERFEELLQRNGLQEARVRLTVTPGATLEVGDAGLPTPTVLVTAGPLGGFPPQTYRDGVAVMIARARQAVDDPLAGHKTTCYLPRLLALRAAHGAKCAEALFFNTSNELAEGAISNVFVVKEGRLRTPPLATPVLPGIARATVLELAAALRIPCDDAAPLTINDLLDADEVFLTNTIIQVLPVVRVEKHDIRGGHVGSLARRLFDAFRANASQPGRAERV